MITMRNKQYVDSSVLQARINQFKGAIDLAKDDPMKYTTEQLHMLKKRLRETRQELDEFRRYEKGGFG